MIKSGMSWVKLGKLIQSGIDIISLHLLAFWKGSREVGEDVCL